MAVVDKRVKKALGRHRRGDVAGAVKLLARVLADNPDDFDGNNLLGAFYAELGELDQAERHLERIRARAASGAVGVVATAQVLTNLGNVWRLRGDIERAADFFGQALEASPGLPQPRYNRVRIWEDTGRNLEAEAEYRRILAAKADFLPARHGLARTLQQLGRHEEAIAEYDRLLSQAKGALAEVAVFARAALAGETVPRPPASYVGELFDNYAGYFEAHVVERLEYSAPRQLRASYPDDARFANALDLGCGTGLAGAAFGDLCGRLIGIDLAPRMIAEAGRREIYHHLECADIVSFLRRARERFDLFLATDVFTYVGDLEEVFAAVAGAAEPVGAELAFSVEEFAGPGFELRPSCRYGHSQAYVAELAGRHAMTIAESRAIDLRHESQGWIPGRLYRLAIPA